MQNILNREKEGGANGMGRLINHPGPLLSDNPAKSLSIKM